MTVARNSQNERKKKQNILIFMNWSLYVLQLDAIMRNEWEEKQLNFRKLAQKPRQTSKLFSFTLTGKKYEQRASDNNNL